MKLKLLLFLICIGLFSCGLNRKKAICGIWDIVAVDLNETNLRGFTSKEIESKKFWTKTYNAVHVGNHIEFFSDGTYELRNNENSKWGSGYYTFRNNQKYFNLAEFDTRQPWEGEYFISKMDNQEVIIEREGAIDFTLKKTRK
jgi:hypothetical protein